MILLLRINRNRTSSILLLKHNRSFFLYISNYISKFVFRWFFHFFDVFFYNPHFCKRANIELCACVCLGVNNRRTSAFGSFFMIFSRTSFIVFVQNKREGKPAKTALSFFLWSLLSVLSFCFHYFIAGSMKAGLHFPER